MADATKPAPLDLPKLLALAADLRKTSLGLTFDQQRSAGVYPALLRAIADGVEETCAELGQARAALKEGAKREVALADAVQHEWSLSKGGKGTFEAMKTVAAAVDAVRAAHGVVPADSGAGKG